jgi:sugar (pentulose or hexulose) kinase
VLLGLDLGTTSFKAVVYDPERGRIVLNRLKASILKHPVWFPEILEAAAAGAALLAGLGSSVFHTFTEATDSIGYDCTMMAFWE